jgi:adenylate cyclase
MVRVEYPPEDREDTVPRQSGSRSITLFVRRLGRPLLRGAAIGLVCGLACWIVSRHPVLLGLEEWFQDANFVNRGVRDSESRVVVVGLDDNSLAEFPEPLAYISPRLGEVVTYLKGRGAEAIGLDLTVPEELDDFSGLKGEALGLAAAQAGNVVLPVLTAEGRVIRPLRVWRTGAPLALVELSDDDDHFLRRQQLAAHVGGQDYYQFGVELLRVAGKVDDRQPDGRLRVNGRVVPVDDRARVRINYVGPAGTIPHVPFRDVLAAARDGPPPTVDFRGAIVIIGATSRWMGDYHATPYANGALRGLWTRPAGLMSGPEFHANLVATLDDGAFLTTPTWLHPFFPVVVLGAVLGAAFGRLSLGRGAALALVHHLGWKAASLAAFVLAHRRVEMVAMLLTGATCYTVTFLLRWRLLRRMFGVVKSEAVVRALEDDPGHLHRMGEERELTVMFSDIRGFTAFSEGRGPREIVALLNAYFGAVVPIVEAHGGVIDKYIGDGLMVLFGAPEDQPDHACRAVRAAVEMVERVHDLQPRWAALKFPGMQIGIGIHTGRAVVGAVGSRSRLDYTAHGDTINAASRIESENKALGTEILISAATYEALPPALRVRLGCSERPEVRKVKGKVEMLRLHRVVVPGGQGRTPEGGKDSGSGSGTSDL